MIEKSLNSEKNGIFEEILKDYIPEKKVIKDEDKKACNLFLQKIYDLKITLKSEKNNSLKMSENKVEQVNDAKGEQEYDESEYETSDYEDYENLLKENK